MTEGTCLSGTLLFTPDTFPSVGIKPVEGEVSGSATEKEQAWTSFEMMRTVGVTADFAETCRGVSKPLCGPPKGLAG